MKASRPRGSPKARTTVAAARARTVGEAVPVAMATRGQLAVKPASRIRADHTRARSIGRRQANVAAVARTACVASMAPRHASSTSSAVSGVSWSTWARKLGALAVGMAAASSSSGRPARRRPSTRTPRWTSITPWSTSTSEQDVGGVAGPAETLECLGPLHGEHVAAHLEAVVVELADADAVEEIQGLLEVPLGQPDLPLGDVGLHRCRRHRPQGADPFERLVEPAEVGERLGRRAGGQPAGDGVVGVLERLPAILEGLLEAAGREVGASQAGEGEASLPAVGLGHLGLGHPQVPLRLVAGPHGLVEVAGVPDPGALPGRPAGSPDDRPGRRSVRGGDPSIHSAPVGTDGRPSARNRTRRPRRSGCRWGPRSRPSRDRGDREAGAVRRCRRRRVSRRHPARRSTRPSSAPARRCGRGRSRRPSSPR